MLHQPQPQVPQVVCQHAQLQAHFVGAESVTRQPCPMRCLLALLDPLLGRAPFVVEPHNRPTRETEIRDDKAHSPEQLSDMVLDFRHDPARPDSNLI